MLPPSLHDALRRFLNERPHGGTVAGGLRADAAAAALLSAWPLSTLLGHLHTAGVALSSPAAEAAPSSPAAGASAAPIAEDVELLCASLERVLLSQPPTRATLESLLPHVSAGLGAGALVIRESSARVAHALVLAATSVEEGVGAAAEGAIAVESGEEERSASDAEAARCALYTPALLSALAGRLADASTGIAETAADALGWLLGAPPAPPAAQVPTEAPAPAPAPGRRAQPPSEAQCEAVAGALAALVAARCEVVAGGGGAEAEAEAEAEAGASLVRGRVCALVMRCAEGCEAAAAWLDAAGLISIALAPLLGKGEEEGGGASEGEGEGEGAAGEGEGAAGAGGAGGAGEGGAGAEEPVEDLLAALAALEALPSLARSRTGMRALQGERGCGAASAWGTARRWAGLPVAAGGRRVRPRVPPMLAAAALCAVAEVYAGGGGGGGGAPRGPASEEGALLCGIARCAEAPLGARGSDPPGAQAALGALALALSAAPAGELAAALAACPGPALALLRCAEAGCEPALRAAALWALGGVLRGGAREAARARAAGEAGGPRPRSAEALLEQALAPHLALFDALAPPQAEASPQAEAAPAEAPAPAPSRAPALLAALATSGGHPAVAAAAGGLLLALAELPAPCALRRALPLLREGGLRAGGLRAALARAAAANPALRDCGPEAEARVAALLAADGADRRAGAARPPPEVIARSH